MQRVKRVITKSRLWAAFFILMPVLLTTAIFVFSPPPPKRITLDPGGRLGEFIEDYSAARVAGQRYIIDGLCISACTLILGEIPPERVCVTPYAKLGFHAAYTLGIMGREFSQEGTALLWILYPEWTREWLKRHGWTGPDKDQPTLIWMEARDLLEIYNECK